MCDLFLKPRFHSSLFVGYCWLINRGSNPLSPIHVNSVRFNALQLLACDLLQGRKATQKQGFMGEGSNPSRICQHYPTRREALILAPLHAFWEGLESQCLGRLYRLEASGVVRFERKLHTALNNLLSFTKDCQ